MPALLDAAREAFQAERERNSMLTGKGEKVTGLTLGVFGLGIVGWEEIPNTFDGLLSVCGFAFLVVSLIYGVWSLCISDYKSYPRGLELEDKLSPLSEEAANRSLVTFYLETREMNAKLNDRKAAKLAPAFVFLLAGTASLMIQRLLRVI